MPTPKMFVHVAATKALEKWLGGTFDRLPSPDGKRVGTQPLITNADLISWQCHVIENRPGSGLYTAIAVEAHSRFTLLLPYSQRPSPEKFWVDLVEAWVGNLFELMVEGGFVDDDQFEQVVQNFTERAAGMVYVRNTDPSVNGHVTEAEQWVRETLAHEQLAQLDPEQAFALGRYISDLPKTAKTPEGKKERFDPVPRFMDDGLYRFGSGLAPHPFVDTPEGEFPNPYDEAWDYDLDGDLAAEFAAELDELPTGDVYRPVDRGLPAKDVAFLAQVLRDYGTPASLPNISALDGFLTSIASSPEPVMPSQWIGALWGGPEQEPNWSSEGEFERFFGLVFEYMNSIIHTLIDQPDEFYPVFNEPQEGQDGYGVEDWCTGYTRAIMAAGDAWESLPEEYLYFLGLINVFGTGEMFEQIQHESPESLPTLASAVPAAARQLHAYSLDLRSHYDPAPPVQQPMRAEPKVGRNDPCPCGSGKKYKKCCLH
ncbi:MULTISPECIES: UPF0149 family protein [unclassified Marinimicrobium]|uniref:UPF0149 family protein n=2 Tax=Cellvibrionaceae TaxID=1706371 RepID=UPI000C5F6C94|nr:MULTISPECIES: UPF0149 family protein [unclassified Marinimicrobium]MAN52541.1 hypothetical protein [Marinimicrobium sp.]